MHLIMHVFISSWLSCADAPNIGRKYLALFIRINLLLFCMTKTLILPPHPIVQSFNCSLKSRNSHRGNVSMTVKETWTKPICHLKDICLLMLILGLFFVFCFFFCFVFFCVCILSCSLWHQTKIIITPFAMRNFQYLSFRDIIKKYEKNSLEIQNPNSENSRLNFIETVQER